MHTEKIIQDLLNQLRDGRLTRKNFEQALFKVIDSHTRQVVETSLYDERTTFIRELYSKIVANSENFEDAYDAAIGAWEYFANKRNEEYQAAMEQAKQKQTKSDPVPEMKVIKDEAISEGV